MASDDSWSDYALCPEVDPEVFFGRGQYLIAKRICNQCPVATECLEDALVNETEFGTWGGTTGPERLVMLRELHGPDYMWPTPNSTYWKDQRMVSEREKAA